VNLSYYLLLRAEGGSVQAHPVVSQLVWLRELHERLEPVDKSLAPHLQKALKVAAELVDEPVRGGTTEKSEENVAATEHVAEPAPRKKISLKERLAQLRATVPRAGSTPQETPSVTQRAPQRHEPATDDLLRLPGRQRLKAARGMAKQAVDGPLDLEDFDPVLGPRRLGATLGEQISGIQQLQRERTNRERAVSPDRNVEAKPRRTGRERPSAEDAMDERDSCSWDTEGDDLMKARGALSKRKAKKAAEEKARDEARAARQFWPQEVLEGRRKTSKHILQNRGLVRQRKAKAGNARVSNRNKYEKMVKRRKGAVQDMREGAGDGATYAGEETGVRSHVRKSLRLS